jgi:hypothetical protein
MNFKIQSILRPILVRLVPNHLKSFTGEKSGRYLARIESNRKLNVDDICAIMKQRGGYTGNPDEAAYTVKAFLDECAF